MKLHACIHIDTFIHIHIHIHIHSPTIINIHILLLYMQTSMPTSTVHMSTHACLITHSLKHPCIHTLTCMHACMPLSKYPVSLTTLQELCSLVASNFCHPGILPKFSQSYIPIIPVLSQFFIGAYSSYLALN